VRPYRRLCGGQGSKTTVEGDARVISVDYSNPESIKSALSGVDVIVSTIAGTALDVQAKIAEAAQAAGVKLFVPSEFGGVTEGETSGLFGDKASIQDQLKVLGVPWAIFYTGPFADFVFAEYVYHGSFAEYRAKPQINQSFLNLDVTTGKVSVAGDGNTQISFTSRPDIARYLAHVLTNLPPDQLKNRSFIIEGDRKVRTKFGILTHGNQQLCDLRAGFWYSHSTKYSRDMKKRPGRNWRSLTSQFPFSMQE
jgi:uncharacterized protein YbjT (DUF2867 family)